jgi:hypothetical protein
MRQDGISSSVTRPVKEGQELEKGGAGDARDLQLYEPCLECNPKHKEMSKRRLAVR